jgi:hypothetical protein
MSRRDGPEPGPEEFPDAGGPEEAGGTEDRDGGDEAAAVEGWIDSLDEPADDDVGAGAGDERGPIGQADVSGELVGEGEGGFADGAEGLPGGDDGQWPELSGDGLEEGWSADETGEAPRPEDDWFLEDAVPALDRDGRDGPLEDRVDGIDEEGWDDLGADGEDGDDGGELPVERAMARLGIELPPELDVRPEVTRLEGGVARDLTFLGPRDGAAVAIDVRGGAPVAAGDEVFALGADGKLHAVRERLPSRATSVCVRGGSIVVGTETAGALRLDHKAARPEAINGWSSLGLETPAGQGISTEFTVFAGGCEDPALFGLTGEGQVFASRDLGEHWAGPLTSGRCFAATAAEDTGELVALVDGPGGIFLVRGHPGRLRATRCVDPGIEALLRAGPARMVAAGPAVAVLPAGALAPLLLSIGGAQLVPLASAPGVTAVALDSDDSAWIAAAFRGPSADRAEVRVSNDGGRSFQVALAIESEDGSGSPAVTALVVDAGTTTKIYAVTGRGVYRLTLRQRTRGH